MKQYNETLLIKHTNSYNKELLKAIKHLKKNDKILAKVIERVGKCTLKPQNNSFQSIVDAIISQQLSMTAATAIFNRLVEYFRPKKFPSPEDILRTSEDDLRKIGISKAKITCLKDLSTKMINKEIHLDNFKDLSDEQIIKELTQVKGIGIWTAHMFLIFSLGRMNVLPTEDLGIRKGIQRLYKLKKLPDRNKIGQISEEKNWSPYNSIASWYIWRSLE